MLSHHPQLCAAQGTGYAAQSRLPGCPRGCLWTAWKRVLASSAAMPSARASEQRESGEGSPWGGFRRRLSGAGHAKRALNVSETFLPSAGRDRPEIDPRPARAINPTFYPPKPPLWGTPPPSPRASVSFASRQWGLGGGGEKRTGEAGEGGVHSEDCRPRRGFLPQGFYPPREDRRGEGVGSNSPRNISPPQDPALPPSWSHHLAPKSCLRTLSLRGVPRYVSPSSGHAILCSQGKWGRGALPSLLCTGGDCP